MKKILKIATLCISCIGFMFGCDNADTPAAVGKKLDKNLTSLYETVSNLDTIDNNYIINPDIYELNTNKKNIDTLITNTIAIPENPEAILLSEDTVNIYENSECNDCENKVEEINNDDIVDTENESTILTEDLEIVLEENIENTNNLNDVIIIDENGDGTVIDSDGKEISSNTITDEKAEDILEETISNNEMTNEQKHRVYHFLFENIRYTPRYANNYNTEVTQTTLNNYLYKVQELYTMTADVVEANNILSSEKEYLLNNINSVKDTNSKMIDGKITPNNQQLIALNNYTQDIRNTIKRIKNSNGQLNNEVNNISTSSSEYGLSKSIDIINSNYLKILNHIDARITYFKSAIATLDQLEFLLKEVEYSIDYTTPSETNVVKNNQYFDNNKESNIDTYKTKENTNTMDKNIEDSRNIKNIDSFNNNLNNDIIDNNSSVYDTNTSTDVNIPNNENIINNDNVNQNTINNNTQNHNLPINTNESNTPNDTYQNGIITQNNLNNGVNNGVNGNMSGYATGNGNVDYFKQNNANRTVENINTYGRNTLVDMINNGTVNNGINTLNMSETNKPIMVDSDYNNCNNCIYSDDNIIDNNIEIFDENSDINKYDIQAENNDNNDCLEDNLCDSNYTHSATNLPNTLESNFENFPAPEDTTLSENYINQDSTATINE